MTAIASPVNHPSRSDEQFTESAKLEKAIRSNLRGLGYDG